MAASPSSWNDSGARTPRCKGRTTRSTLAISRNGPRPRSGKGDRTSKAKVLSPFPDHWSGEQTVSHESAVWITGVGTATPLGNSYLELAENLLAGRSGVRPIQGFDVSDHPSQIGSQIDQIPCPPGWGVEEFGRLPRLEQLALWCCINALHDSGWWDRRQEVRVGLVL